MDRMRTLEDTEGQDMLCKVEGKLVHLTLCKVDTLCY